MEESLHKQNLLEKEAEAKQQLIKDLEQQQKKQKMKHMEESRKKAQEIDKLKAELESKSNQIAYLTTELHKYKRIQAEGSHSASRTHTNEAIPIPPVSQHPTRINRGALGRQGKPVDSEELERRGLRVSSAGRSTSSSRSNSPIEMAKPFLRRDDAAEAEAVHVRESMRYPLPPIKSLQGKEGLNKQRVLVRKVVPPPHPMAVKHRRNFKTTDLPLLAVDQVSGTNEAAKWAQSSHSREYN